MGNIQIRGNSVRIRVSDGFDPKTNARRYKTRTIHLDPNMTERQKQEEITRQRVLFEEQCRQEQYIDDSITLNVFIEQWRQDYEQTHLKNTTQRHYDDLLKRIQPALGHLKLSEITPLHLNAFYKNLAEEGIRIDYKYKCRIDFRKFMKDNDISRYKLIDAAGISVTTLESMAAGNNVSKETAFGISEALEIQPEELFDVIGTDRKFSSKTLLHYHRCLSAILAKAVKWGFLFSNPCERVDPPKLRRREAKCLDEEQTLQLINALDDKGQYQYSVMVKLMIFSGARRAEICGLEWNDVDWESGCIHICRNSLYLPNVGMYEDSTKTESSERYVKLPQSVMTMLAEFREYQNGIREQMGEGWQASGKIFTQYNGLPIHPSSVTTWLRKFTARNGLPHATPHMLRHTSATMLLMQGVPLKAVSKRLGHTLASTTSDIYGHSLRSVEDIAANKLEALLTPSEQFKKDDE